MNLNKAIIVGRITKDPEIRALPSGTKVASFGMATNRFYRQNEEKKQEVEFHNISVFGKLSDVVENYVKKGGLVLVEGRIKTDTWEKDGIKRYSTKIIAESIQLGPKPQGQTQEKPYETAQPVNMDDIPVIEEGPKGQSEIDVDNIDFG